MSKLSSGDPAPQFELVDVVGENQALESDAAATAVVFTCNHCPFALAWHDRLVEVARDYGDKKVRVLAINSDNPANHPQETVEASRARWEIGKWPFAYAHDLTQDVARSFGAATTPEVFVFDADLRLRYQGAIDADYADPAAGARWLRDALDSALEGDSPELDQTEPYGCSIKWSEERKEA